MWNKIKLLQEIYNTGIIVIIRAKTENEAYNIAKAAIEGGIRALEFPYGVPGALNLITELSNEYREKNLIIGAGTVLDSSYAGAALIAGANMLVSSSVCPEMIEMGHLHQAVTVCGAMSPTEITSAMKKGADLIKLFPADCYSPKYIKTIQTPMPGAAIVPFGGVTLDNLVEWFDAGAAAVGIGSAITKIDNKDTDYESVVLKSSQFLKKIKEDVRDKRIIK